MSERGHHHDGQAVDAEAGDSTQPPRDGIPPRPRPTNCEPCRYPRLLEITRSVVSVGLRSCDQQENRQTKVGQTPNQCKDRNGGEQHKPQDLVYIRDRL